MEFPYVGAKTENCQDETFTADGTTENVRGNPYWHQDADLAQYVGYKSAGKTEEINLGMGRIK